MRQSIKWILGLPVAALLAVLLIGGYVRSKASGTTDFNIRGSELLSYSGSEKNVIVPDGIEVIGREAFAANPYIVSVKLPDSVRMIDYAAFADCSSLNQILLPDSVTTIGDSAFNHCQSLKTVSFGTGLNSLGSGVFADCPELSEIKIAEDNQAFVCVDGVLYDAAQSKIFQYLCGRKKHQYRMPDTVEEIARYAFWGCDQLEDITFSAALTEIPDYAIADAAGIETVTINAPLQTIGLKAFEGCTSLKQIVFPMSVTKIHESAFDNCNTEMLFVCEPGSYVETYALEHGLTTSQTIRYQVSYFEEKTDPSVTASASAQEKEPGQDQNVESEKDQENTTSGGVEVSEGVVLGGARIVSDRAFVMAGNMIVTDGSTLDQAAESVTLPAINDYAYYNNPELTHYEFPIEEPVEVIGQLAFARTGLTKIVIPEGVRTISYGAFYHCDDLSEVSIPSTVTNVEAYAFEYTPWLENWRNEEDTGDYLIVGDGVLISYKGSGNVIVLPENVKYIASGVFRDHTELESVTFPEGLISIGSYAFSGCTNLDELTGLQDAVYLDSTAFENL